MIHIFLSWIYISVWGGVISLLYGNFKSQENVVNTKKYSNFKVIFDPTRLLFFVWLSDSGVLSASIQLKVESSNKYELSGFYGLTVMNWR